MCSFTDERQCIYSTVNSLTHSLPWDMKNVWSTWMRTSPRTMSSATTLKQLQSSRCLEGKYEILCKSFWIPDSHSQRKSNKPIPKWELRIIKKVGDIPIWELYFYFLKGGYSHMGIKENIFFGEYSHFSPEVSILKEKKWTWPIDSIETFHKFKSWN